MKRWQFLVSCFRQDVIAAAKEAGMKRYEIDALCGLSFTSSMTRDGWMPTMRNYLAICEALDLNPNDYIDEDTNNG